MDFWKYFCFENGSLFDIPIVDIDVSNIDFRKKKWRSLLKHINMSSCHIRHFVKKAKAVFIIARNCHKWFRYHQRRAKGPCVHVKEISTNQEDIMLMTNITEIPSPFFFSFCEDNGRRISVYSFDIRYFEKLGNVNPYTRNSLSLNTQSKIQERLQHLVMLAYELKIPLEKQPKRSRRDRIRQRVVHLFSEMDSLDSYTNVSWFFELDRFTLKQWFEETRFVFEYRAELTEEEKELILPDSRRVFAKDAFSIAKTLETFQEITVEAMIKLVTSGSTREDRTLGCYYALTGLVICCPQAAEALPWLVNP